MDVDINLIDNNSIIETDICVVGAGPAGITFAREFIGTSVEVAIIESGSLNYDGVDTVQELNNGFNQPVNEEVGKGIPHYDLTEIRTRAFGGSSHLWRVPLPDEKEGVRLRGLEEIDFEKRDWVPNSGWPIQKKDLDPYYKQSHDLFKIEPYRYDADLLQNYQNGNPQMPLKTDNLKTTIFHFARKNVFYNDYYHELEQAKNIRLFLHSTVLNIDLQENGKMVNSLTVITNNEKRYTVKAKKYVLALGGIETPRLMLLSNDVMTNGVGNQNDLVGRYFMEHLHIENGVFRPYNEDLYNYSKLYKIHKHGSGVVQGKITLSEDLKRKEQLLNATTALYHIPMFKLQETKKALRGIPGDLKRARFGRLKNKLATVSNNFGLISYASMRKLMKGDKKKWYEKKYKYHAFWFGFMSEQIPDPESRVLLDESLDMYGQKKVKLNWKMNMQDVISLKRTLDLMANELKKNNIGELHFDLDGDSIPQKVHGGKHHMGTTRMHTNPMEGVVDENCKVHGIQNLYVAGSSVFPTGGYANPTLTITALSLRLADYFKVNS